jgi:HEAT repeat protein
VLAALSTAAPPAPAADTPRLQTLVPRAPLVVAARVTAVEAFDAGRVAVATLGVTATPKGEPPTGPVRVVEMRDLPSVPTLLDKGMLVVAFLEPLRGNSYLTRTLPRAEYRQLVAGRIGRIVAATPAESEEIVGVLDRILEASRVPEPDPVRRAAATRALVFDEVGARSGALVEDGAAGLQSIPELAASLSADEQQRLEAAIGRTDLSPQARAALVRAIGANGLRQLVPALQGLKSPAAPVVAARFEALERLGVPPTVDDVEPYLDSKDPAVRTAATRALVETPGSEGLARAGRVALADPDPAVRRATAEALGESRRAEALPALERVFRQAPTDLQQVAGRGIYQVGGPAAAEVLVRLAFEAPPESQRLAVVLLLALQGKRDDPLVQRIATTHPDAELRRLVEHGVELPHSHGAPH